MTSYIKILFLAVFLAIFIAVPLVSMCQENNNNGADNNTAVGDPLLETDNNANGGDAGGGADAGGGGEGDAGGAGGENGGGNSYAQQFMGGGAGGGVTATGIVANILSITTKIAVFVVVIFWIITGLLFLTAQGDPTKLGTAKKAVIASVIGTAIAILAGSASNIIGTAITTGG